MKASLKARFGDFVLRIRRLVRSVRFRLLAWSLLIVAVILVGFSTFVYAQETRDIEIDSMNRVRMLARQFTTAFRSSLVVINPPGEPGEAPGSASQPVIPAASSFPTLQANDAAGLLDVSLNIIQKVGQISDADLKALTQSWQGPTEDYNPLRYTLAIPVPNGQVKKQDYYFVVARFPDDRNPESAFLIVGSPVDPDGRLPSLALNLVLGSLAVLLITLVGGYWLAGRVMRPVQTITHTARQISESDLRRRLNLGTQDELGELADTFDQMLARLEAAFNRQRQFTADASHELRTPLTIIELETERALERHRSPAEYQQALTIIQNENEYMASLVNDLLTLARMDAGQATLKPETMDLSDVALEVVERLATLAQRSGVELVAGDLPEVPLMGDRRLLVQMLTNLVGNAIKYVDGENKSVQVVTGSRMNGKQPVAWAQVIDNGPGISPEHLPHLFDRFYRIDKSRTRQEEADAATELKSLSGSGLGLAIVQWIAQAHGGKVSVTSEMGKGSIFEVDLPGI
ncbi:MAG TPA: HAMP domain-containing sensor histidine kinase [Anaerolineaceae bacterium]|nr:HAMP domain-containing sensor histidine kinase [Anaerolineaceae bacterium]